MTKLPSSFAPLMGNATDAVLTALEAQPFRLWQPARQRAPFVFASPHSGRHYPAEFVAASRLSPLALRRSEDAYVDELFDGVVALGCPLLAAEFPRAYVDANRAAGELDPEMFAGALSLECDPATPRVAAGLGVIPRVVREGVEIYGSKLDPAEAERRLNGLYRPYHVTLAALVHRTITRFGCAVVVDCHSMPSVPAAPGIVFGDCYGTSLSATLMRHIERSFAVAGFSTARNAPYAGGFTTHFYACRDAGIHAVQIEVNRSLYLDEDQVEKTAGFAGVKGRLGAALAPLLDFDFAQLLPRRPLAAE